MDPMVVSSIIGKTFAIKSKMSMEKKLKEMVTLYEEQSIFLESLNTSIEMLKIGPFYSAKVHLEDALKKHRTKKERINLVLSAKENLVQVLGVFNSKKEKDYKDYYFLCIIHLYIAMCWNLLGKKTDSKHWVHSSLQKCLKAVDSILQLEEDLLVQKVVNKNEIDPYIKIQNFTNEIDPYLKIQNFTNGRVPKVVSYFYWGSPVFRTSNFITQRAIDKGNIKLELIEESILESAIVKDYIITTANALIQQIGE